MATIASPVKSSIIAERFKTKMCQNHEKTGACPYEIRCMFAHGESELRTKEMNLEEGLTTDDAIKAFQRTRKVAVRRAERRRMRRQRAAVAKAGLGGENQPASTTRDDDNESDSDSAYNNGVDRLNRDSPDSQGQMPATPQTLACKKTPAVSPLEPITEPKVMQTPPARVYRRHNPYAPTLRSDDVVAPSQAVARRLSFTFGDDDTGKLSADNAQMLPPPMPLGSVLGDGAASPLVAAMSARRPITVMC